MGLGYRDEAVYAASKATRAATGASAFTHTTAVRAGKATAGVHETLNPLDSDGNLVRREARDSDDHPNSTPIAILFDETGSMGSVPARLVDKLTEFFTLVNAKGYCDDPQVMFGGIGDGQNYEKAPLQVGQFESDNKMEADLGNIFLEGLGGGNRGESYGLAFYFFANQVDTDNWDKRGEKGYLFIIGDEAFLPDITPREARDYLGLDINEAISVRSLIEQCQERWHVFFIHVQESSYGNQSWVVDPWREALGEGYIPGTSVESVCETIAIAVGLKEGTTTLDDALGHLDEVGSSGIKDRVSKSLATVGSNTTGTVATSSAPGGLSATGEAGVDRL